MGEKATGKEDEKTKGKQRRGKKKERKKTTSKHGVFRGLGSVFITIFLDWFHFWERLDSSFTIPVYSSQYCEAKAILRVLFTLLPLKHIISTANSFG